MGLETFSAVADATAASSISALGTSTTIGFVRRMKVDTILNISTGSYDVVGLTSVDGGSSGTVRASLTAYDNNGPKAVKFNWGSGGVTIGPIAAASWGAAGTYITVYCVYDYVTFDYAMGIFTGAGTNTLLDGLAKASSAFWKAGSYNAAIANSLAANGIVHDNFAYGGTGTNSPASVVDGVGVLSAPRASGYEDAIPGYVTADQSNFFNYWFYNASGATIAAQLSGPSLALSGTYAYAAGGVWPVLTSTPTTVVATPSTLQINLPAGTTGTSALETLDQNNSVMAGRTWAIDTAPSGSVATASITGSTLTVTAVAAGQTSLTVKDTGSGGSSAAEATVQITVGTEYDWVSSNTSIVTVGTGGATETATDPPADTAGGTATITITRHGTSATATVAVTSAGSSGGGSGSPNEPSGMTVCCNSGSLTVAPPTPTQVAAGTTSWVIGSTIQNTVEMFSPGGSQPANGYQSGWAGNLTLCPDGPGYRLTYQTGLAGGYSPARFGFPLAAPSGAVGIGYWSWYMRLESGWSWLCAGGAATKGVKVSFQRTTDTQTNHALVLSADNGTGTYEGYVNLFLQGPGGQSLDVPEQNASAWNASTAYEPGDTVSSSGTYYCILANTNKQPPNATYWTLWTPSFSVSGLEPDGLIPADGDWHHVEVLITQDNPAGSKNGQVQFWVDGTAYMPITPSGLSIIPTDNNATPPVAYVPGWPYYMFDPTWGGAVASPAQQQTMDIDRLYMSQK